LKVVSLTPWSMASKNARAGDSVYIEPNVVHGVVCREAGVLLDIFRPAREDFLEERKA
jgi:quercetin dioxygenase-like cupin family protein